MQFRKAGRGSHEASDAKHILHIRARHAPPPSPARVQRLSELVTCTSVAIGRGEGEAGIPSKLATGRGERLGLRTCLAADWLDPPPAETSTLPVTSEVASLAHRCRAQVRQNCLSCGHGWITVMQAGTVLDRPAPLPQPRWHWHASATGMATSTGVTSVRYCPCRPQPVGRP